MKTIDVIVSRVGEITVEARGYAGSDCLEATRLLEAALGHKTSDRITADFYQQTAQAQRRLQR